MKIFSVESTSISASRQLATTTRARHFWREFRHSVPFSSVTSSSNQFKNERWTTNQEDQSCVHFGSAEANHHNCGWHRWLWRYVLQSINLNLSYNRLHYIALSGGIMHLMAYSIRVQCGFGYHLSTNCASPFRWLFRTHYNNTRCRFARTAWKAIIRRM